MAELDRDRYIEREREWNKRQPPPRPSSSLSSSSNHSHTHPARPPSAAAYSIPTHASLHRQASSSSLKRLSGASSPASSLASSHGSEDHKEQEVTHERERNWNSPHPKWGTARHHSHVSGNEVSPARTHLSRSKNGGSRPSSRASGIIRSSLIPVRASPKKNGIFSSDNFSSSTPAKVDDEKEFTKGHRRRSMELTESVNTIPPQTSISGAFQDEDMVLGDTLFLQPSNIFFYLRICSQRRGICVGVCFPVNYSRYTAKAFSGICAQRGRDGSFGVSSSIATKTTGLARSITLRYSFQ